MGKYVGCIREAKNAYKILVRKYERQRFPADIDTIGRIGELVLWEPSCPLRTDGRADRQRDMANLIVAFSKFVNAPKERL